MSIEVGGGLTNIIGQSNYNDLLSRGGPSGRRGSPMIVPGGTNKPTRVDDVDYTGHAIDQMQGIGIPPSAVKDTIKNGKQTPSNDGATRHVGSEIYVITSPEGKVITVIPK